MPVAERAGHCDQGNRRHHRSVSARHNGAALNSYRVGEDSRRQCPHEFSDELLAGNPLHGRSTRARLALPGVLWATLSTRELLTATRLNLTTCRTIDFRA